MSAGVGIVTGASRGLGLALVRSLSERGWRLAVDARERGALERAVGLVGPAAADGGDDGCLDGFLSRPALLIGGQTQIATGDEKNGITHLSLLWHGCMLS